ncbi:radical SAM protein [Klebsiella grimontii]|uniref:radical SAM protein n=1 Tax=Klebsiella grimontii TaxID=2058152 RepID=UPI001BD0FC42|nr:radical SAM protein [Klebsiella grimontii]
MGDALKTSYYNVVTSIENQEYIIFNTRTGRALKLNQQRFDEYVFFQDNNRGDQDYIDVLTKLEFLVPENMDEIKHIKKRYHSKIDGGKKLTVTVGLTENCNFRCVYCYQAHEITNHDEKISDAFIELLTSKEWLNFTSLHINWFGGEPLLKMDLIKKLNSYAIEFCKANKWDLTQSITTNGSLINDSKMNDLKSMGIRNFQITVDGESEQHNATRPFHNGISSYDKVIQGIGKVINSNCHCIIRINLNRPVGDKIEQLIDDIIGQGANKNNSVIHVVRALNHKDGSVDGFYYSNEEYSHVWVKCLKKIKAYGFHIPHVLPIPYNCSFDNGKTVFIDHNGLHGSCSSIPTNNDDSKIKISFIPLYEKNTLFGVKKREDSFFDSYCRKCKILPSCVGGCQYLEKAGQEKCSPEKYVIEDLIRLNYS